MKKEGKNILSFVSEAGHIARQGLVFLILLSIGYLTAEEVTDVGVQESAVSAVSSVGQDVAKKIQTINSCANQVWPNLKLGQYPLFVADYNGTTQLNSLQEINPISGLLTNAPAGATNHIRNARYSRYFTDVPGAIKTGVAVSIGGPRPGSGGKLIDARSVS